MRDHGLIKIAALAAIDGSLCGRIVKGLAEGGVRLEAVIVDVKPELQRDKSLHEERTGGRMPPMGFEVLEPYQTPFYLVADHNNAACVDLVRSLSIDILVNAGTPRILKKHVLSAPKLGTLNCHPGLLPYFRGCSAVEWALFLDEPVGNTVHFMTEGIDEGPILAKEQITIKHQDSYQDIRCLVYQSGIDLFAKTAKAIQIGELDHRLAERQSSGRYFPPIPSDAMARMLKTIRKGAYGPRQKLGSGNYNAAVG